MERTITQNGALYALQHRAPSQLSNHAQMKRAAARGKIPPPPLDATTVTPDELSMEENSFTSSKLNLALPAR